MVVIIKIQLAPLVYLFFYSKPLDQGNMLLERLNTLLLNALEQTPVAEKF